MKRVKIIAELSANHNQNINIAKDTIKVAKQVGADAIKIQTYTPDTLTIDCDNDYFRLNQGTIWDGTTLYKLYKEAYTPWEWHKELFDYSKSIGIEIFSTPFDKTAVDLLEMLENPVYKIASFEITDIPLIKYTASKGKPMIISIGIATLEEISEAVEACRKEGNNQITLLQCTSEYPAKPEDANLSIMLDLKQRFNVNIGISDHTLGHEVATVAAAMGATILEKHFIIDRNIGGPDSSFSMNPSEFELLVKNVRRVETLLGQVSYDITKYKAKNRTFARSLFIVQDVKEGQEITEENVRSIRPGYGLAPKYLKDVLGKNFSEDIKKGTPLTWEAIVK